MKGKGVSVELDRMYGKRAKAGVGLVVHSSYRGLEMYVSESKTPNWHKDNLYNFYIHNRENCEPVIRKIKFFTISKLPLIELKCSKKKW